MRILSHIRELGESLEDWRRYPSISIEELQMDHNMRNMALYKGNPTVIKSELSDVVEFERAVLQFVGEGY